MAPRARIAMYKVCWEARRDGGCVQLRQRRRDRPGRRRRRRRDQLLDRRHARRNFLDPVEVAFLFAADAGVFVAASAGNSGPAPARSLTRPVADHRRREHARPRRPSARSTLGNGATYIGASTHPAPSTRCRSCIVAEARGRPARSDARPSSASHGTLDPAKVAGKIVVCDRGVNARIDKSLEVKRAGGVGMVLINTTRELAQRRPPLRPDGARRPTRTARRSRRTRATPGATATIVQRDGRPSGAAGPDIAAFSSRGPILAGGGDILKPDIAAPGVDVLAAVAPPGNPAACSTCSAARRWRARTSPASRALLKQLHPDWSPTAIKSALMTTAYDGSTPRTRRVRSGRRPRRRPNAPPIRASSTTPASTTGSRSCAARLCDLRGPPLRASTRAT